jgi:hypothetical protein
MATAEPGAQDERTKQLLAFHPKMQFGILCETNAPPDQVIEENLRMRQEILRINDTRGYVKKQDIGDPSKLVTGAEPSLLDLAFYADPGDVEEPGFAWVNKACTPPRAMCNKMGFGDHGPDVYVWAGDALCANLAAVNLSIVDVIALAADLYKYHKEDALKIFKAGQASIETQRRACAELCAAYNSVIGNSALVRMRTTSPATFEEIDRSITQTMLLRYFHEFEICVNRLRNLQVTALMQLDFYEPGDKKEMDKEHKQFRLAELDNFRNKPLDAWRSSGRTCKSFDYLLKHEPSKVTQLLYVPLRSEIQPSMLSEICKVEEIVKTRRDRLRTLFDGGEKGQKLRNSYYKRFAIEYEFEKAPAGTVADSIELEKLTLEEDTKPTDALPA